MGGHWTSNPSVRGSIQIRLGDFVYYKKRLEGERAKFCLIHEKVREGGCKIWENDNVRIDPLLFERQK